MLWTKLNCVDQYDSQWLAFWWPHYISPVFWVTSCPRGEIKHKPLRRSRERERERPGHLTSNTVLMSVMCIWFYLLFFFGNESTSPKQSSPRSNGPTPFAFLTEEVPIGRKKGKVKESSKGIEKEKDYTQKKRKPAHSIYKRRRRYGGDDDEDQFCY